MIHLKIKTIVLASALLTLLALTACRSSGYANPLDAHYGIVMQLGDGIELRYINNAYIDFSNGRIVESIMYYAPAGYGAYFFTPGDWSNDQMRALIALGEDGIRFAKDWLGYNGGETVATVFGNREYLSATNWKSVIQRLDLDEASAYNGEVFINMSDASMPVRIVQEAAHAILGMEGIRSNFPRPPVGSGLGTNVCFFKQGLCHVIDYLFFMETDHLYEAQRYGFDRQAAQNLLHENALAAIERNNHFEDVSEYGTYPQLRSRETAASFIYYLLGHKGTKDDFMQVFVDINRMQEVYGTTMEAMITEWLAYITGAAW